MGAGVALNVAVRYPRRVAGLVLSRPAWLDGPMPPENVSRYAAIARLLRQVGAARDQEVALRGAVAELEASDDFRELFACYYDTALSLRGQLTSMQAVTAVARLERLPADRPVADPRSVEEIRVPALVMAHRQDPIHRFAFGEKLAHLIPRARFVELTPKSIAREFHAAEVQGALEGFLSGFLPSRV
jgi:pimeloyl-ACP methyl ester carboxylesterase